MMKEKFISSKEHQVVFNHTFNFFSEY